MLLDFQNFLDKRWCKEWIDIRWHFFTFISNNTSQPHIKLCLTFTVSSFLWLLLALRLFFVAARWFSSGFWLVHWADVTLRCAQVQMLQKRFQKCPRGCEYILQGFVQRQSCSFVSFIYFMYQSAEEKTVAKWPADFLLFVAYCDFQKAAWKDWLAP